jgi:TRAP-type C4-dicarboxylate transport system substrate-binding protein
MKGNDMRTIKGWVLAFGMATASLMWSGFVHAQNQWTMDTLFNPSNFSGAAAGEFADRVRTETHGAVDITVHYGGSLGFKGPDHLAAVRDGLIQLADIQMNQQVGEGALWGIESLPFLATGYRDLATLRTFSRPVFERMAEKANQRILYILPWPPQNLFVSKPVGNNLAEFRNVTIRTIDRNASDFFTSLGAKTVQMPWGELLPALASGAVNGVATSSTGAVQASFWEFLHYYVELQWQMNSQMVTVNADAWDQVDTATQERILKIASEIEEKYVAVSKAEDAKNIALLNSKGMKTIIPTAEVKESMRKAGESMWSAYAVSAGPDAKAILADYAKARAVGK